MTVQNFPISIITPTLNSGKYIEKCIQSVRNQSIKVEHIIVDGGSTDDTLKILQKYPDIKYISESDHGMYDAVNKGLSLSNGDIVGYLNADDRYCNLALSKVINVFKKIPEADFVYGACTYINDDEKELYTYKSLPYFNKLLRNMKRICWAQSSCFWRISIHDKIGKFDSSLKYCGDYAFFNHLVLNNCRGIRINKPLSYFMLHEDSLSVKAEMEMYNEYSKIETALRSKRNFLLGCLGEVCFKLINLSTYPKILMNRKQIAPRRI